MELKSKVGLPIRPGKGFCRVHELKHGAAQLELVAALSHTECGIGGCPLYVKLVLECSWGGVRSFTANKPNRTCPQISHAISNAKILK